MPILSCYNDSAAMKQLPPFSDRYWLKFSNDPVIIKPFDPLAVQVAQEYIQKLTVILGAFSPIEMYHRGSTALKIAGKGDVEIGVLPNDDYWFEVLVRLSQYYKGLGNLDEEYARFNDQVGGFDIEIILMRRYTAELDKKLHGFLRANSELLDEYERIKRNYCHSQREYNLQKDSFFRRVINEIPD